VGIDPGYAIVGWGVIEYNSNRFTTLKFGAITTPAHTDFSKRLEMIYDDACTLFEKAKPDAVAIEKLFFNTNTTTAIDVAEARGVIILAATKQGIPVFEYTPLQVKQAVTGYGRAEKRQVMELTKQFLGLSEVPKPDDTADALALAICHAYSSSTSYAKLVREAKQK
jgi:crossover junction endodeoxyribonuclease RuvC